MTSSKPKEKLKILFLCTGNSCRSQMAEGWARHLKSDQITAYSAGTHPQGLNPIAVQTMAEEGVDISHHTSKTLDSLSSIQFDYVITVCGHADENCPLFPGTTRLIHHGFDDPPKLAETVSEDTEKKAIYRRVSLEIRNYVATLPESLSTPGV